MRPWYTRWQFRLSREGLDVFTPLFGIELMRSKYQPWTNLFETGVRLSFWPLLPQDPAKLFYRWEWEELETLERGVRTHA